VPVAGVPPNQTTRRSVRLQSDYRIFGCLFSISLAACISGATPPRDLLLGSSDFPSVHVTEIVRETSTTNEGEPAVQVKLRVPDFTVLEA